MVVFTCNYCGDSVKKPKAEKHITLECKRKRHGCASFCCVDCLNDFNIETYRAHTKCVTEEQRYSAPGFVPKPSSCKGERKQSFWLDAVQTVLRKPNLSMPQKQLLQAISSYDNIPRKKVKFLNFIRNSGNFARIPPNIVDAVYGLIELELKAASAQVVANKTENTPTPNGKAAEEKSDKADISNAAQAESIDSKPDVENVNGNSDVLRSRKKKKEKANIEKQEIVNNDGVVDLNENPDFAVVKSKKKKKKNKSEKTEDSSMNGTVETDSNENSHLPTNDLEQKIENTGNDCSIQNYDEAFTAKKSKGKKKYKNKENISNDPTEADVDKNSEPMDNDIADFVSVYDKNGDGIPQNKRRNKRKFETSEPESEVHSKRSRVENDEMEIRPKKFNWEDVVKKLLEKSKDGDMSLKKMTKKVVAEYQSSFSSVESFEDISKKLNKKMKKLPFVILSKERVSLYVQ